VTACPAPASRLETTVGKIAFWACSATIDCNCNSRRRRRRRPRRRRRCNRRPCRRHCTALVAAVRYLRSA